MVTSSHADAQAATVLRQNGRSFHFASHVLGARHGQLASRLYALCRAIDDLADDTPDAAKADARLAQLSQALRMADPADRIAAMALRLHAETELDIGALQALIEGVRSDLKPVAIADEAELLNYAYAVAGTVGLMMCAVLDVKDPRAAPFAIDLGMAMQLTNIARDVSEDAKLGRRYLPASWVGQIDAAELISPHGATAEATRLAVQRLLALAEIYYESGEAGLCFLPARARLAILIAARVYRGIGGRLAAQQHEPWHKRAVVSGGRKCAIAFKALVAFLLNPRVHHMRQPHEARLHAAIAGKPGARDGL
jgi:phytoene synthase